MNIDMFAQDKKIVFLLCTLIFIVSGAFCLWTGNHTSWPDESVYIEIAKRLVAGYGFSDETCLSARFSAQQPHQRSGLAGASVSRQGAR